MHMIFPMERVMLCTVLCGSVRGEEIAMSKFSVKKPFTVFVAVIAVIVLGVVAYLKMTPDLLPNMDFPYVMIMTTYPGASPEKVEQELTKPLEQSMSTLEHIKEVTSTSAENYSMVMLEFEEDVNLDTIGVDIQQELTALSATWDAMVGAPYVLKINPSMLPIEVAAVSMEGMDTVQLTEFLDETLMNKLEGIAGVARISASGLVEQQLHVVLDQEKINAVNQMITDAINGKMDEALEELNKTKQELQDAQTQMEDAKQQLQDGKDALADQMAAGEAELSYQQSQLLSTKSELQAQLAQLRSGKTQLETTLSVLKAVASGVEELTAQMDGISNDLEILLGLQRNAEELEALQKAFEEQMEQIRQNAELSEEEIEAAIQEILESEEYKQLQEDLAALQETLDAYGISLEDLETVIEENRAALEDLQQRIDALRDMLPETGGEEGSLTDQITEMENNIAMIDEGIVQIEDGIKQIDSGMLQLKDAAQLLSSKKTAGLLELSNAANELAVNGATVSAALTQVEGGIETLEKTRTDTLAKSDLNKLLTMEMVSQILTAQNFAMPAGYVEQDGISYMVSVGQEITDQETVEGLLLFDMGLEGVEPIYLRDVAVIALTDNRDESYAKLDGLDSIVLSFEKQSTYATAEATNNIADRFRELEGEYPGLEFVALMDQGDYIYLIVETILSSLLLGAVFSVLILFVFLKDLRPTFITLCSIPISVIFAIVLMYFSGVTINMISLSGLAVSVGMLVDNSVVVIENIYRLRAKGANAIQAAVSGATQVAGAVIASTLTTVCVFLPIVFIEGITKQLFTDLALTMTYSLLASLIVALTLVPAMASGILRKEKPMKQTFMEKFLGVYEKLLSWSLKHKAMVLIASAVLLVATAALSISRGFIFMPPMDMPNVNVSITMPEDTTAQEAAAYADEVLSRIETVDGIETVGAMMGGGLSLTGSSGNNITVYVILEDDTASGAAVGKQIVELCKDLECTVTASSAMMDMSMLTGSGISMNIYADDMDALKNAARKAAEVLGQVEGVQEVSNGLEDAVPALHIQVDRNKAMAQGITVAQIYMELAAALQTETTAATLQLAGTSTDVIIGKPADARVTADELADYPFEVTGATGETKTFVLGDVAEIVETTSLSSISRANQRRYLTVTGTLAEGENVTVVTSRAETLIRRTDLGDGVSYAFTGENETIMEAIEQLGLMLLLGVLLVYLVMVAQFQSLKSPFIVMFTIPLAFTGGFIGLLLCGMEVSVISLIGFVMLTGIIVNNGIVLVDYINQLRAEGMARVEAIVEAGKTRMRPILMTSITTILGLCDMALRQNVGTALMQPVAVVCIGGLVYATLMTLFVVPCIYDMMNKKQLRTVKDEDLKILDI